MRRTLAGGPLTWRSRTTSDQCCRHRPAHPGTDSSVLPFDERSGATPRYCARRHAVAPGRARRHESDQSRETCSRFTTSISGMPPTSPVCTESASVDAASRGAVARLAPADGSRSLCSPETLGAGLRKATTGSARSRGHARRNAGDVDRLCVCSAANPMVVASSLLSARTASSSARVVAEALARLASCAGWKRSRGRLRRNRAKLSSGRYELPDRVTGPPPIVLANNRLMS